MHTLIIVCALLVSAEATRGVFKEDIKHVSAMYPHFGSFEKIRPNAKNMWHQSHLSDPYSLNNWNEMPGVELRIRRDGIFGNFDPNAFNSQIGSNFNPNTFGGGGSSGSSSGSGSSGSSMFGGGSMFNPNAMMGSMMGGASGGTSGTQQQTTGSALPTQGTSQVTSISGTASGGFDPNNAGTGGAGGFNPNTAGTASGGSGMVSGAGANKPPGVSSGGVSSGSMPSYDPNNAVNTGAKYDPNAANSGMGGSGGASPSFSNGMGMNASQQMPGGSQSGTSGSGGVTTSGSSGGINPASGFGSATSGSAPGSPSGSSSVGGSSFGSASGGTGAPQTGTAPGTGGNTGTAAGVGPVSQGGGNTQSGGSAGGTGGPNFDPNSANSMATSGFNPLNPMMGKDMSVVMGPQTQAGGNNPGGFDPSSMNAALGSQGMSLNMFGGAGGQTDLNKADAGSLMTGAQGMMAGSNTLLGGGNAVLGAGSGTGGTSAPSASNFDPNQMGSTTSPSSGGTNSGNAGGMNVFDPNAMMGGGSVNPMMPGGGMNPMMPGGSMTGGTSGTRDSSGGSNPAKPAASPLDPLGAMTGGAKNFSGGGSLMDPMGFMNGGGLTGSMGNTFSVNGRRAVRPIPVDNGRVSREASPISGGNVIDLLRTLGTYNPMDPMGFIFKGNNKDYTSGNGVDTPPYDPDNFAYLYAGSGYSPKGSQFMSDPSFIPSEINAESLDHSPNYSSNTRTATVDVGSVSSPTQPSQVGNKDSFGNAESNANENPLSSRPSISADQQIHGIVSQSLPEGIFEGLNLNASYMFPETHYSGQPGMLGIGAQFSLNEVKPEITGNIESQYIPQNIKNASETIINEPVYSGFPGMKGSDKQDQGSVGDAVRNMSGNFQPQYAGVPGMLGYGQMTSMDRDWTGSGLTDADGTSSGSSRNTGAHSYSNNQNKAGSFQATGGPGSLGTGMVPFGVNENNWKGEWPGKTDAGGDWSGDWAEKWPESAAEAGSSAGQSRQPVNHGEGSVSTHGGADKPELTAMETTLSALQRLMTMLDMVPSNMAATQNAPSANPSSRS
ncbi:hornerin-like isoform X2 [Dreissena polymorpha]|uniref:hornerin-like isoform X2 n=1 Tax=Dreissena polymorpha TaxID=45954 RepID=UPI00226512D6|nr:hornerin-like isoform X2 [Dreissena polymorpha]